MRETIETTNDDNDDNDDVDFPEQYNILKS